MSFKEWLEKMEMTSMSSVGGGGTGMTSTADVARFARPLGFTDDPKKKKGNVVRDRQYPLKITFAHSIK